MLTSAVVFNVTGAVLRWLCSIRSAMVRRRGVACVFFAETAFVEVAAAAAESTRGSRGSGDEDTLTDVRGSDCCSSGAGRVVKRSSCAGIARLAATTSRSRMRPVRPLPSSCVQSTPNWSALRRARGEIVGPGELLPLPACTAPAGWAALSPLAPCGRGAGGEGWDDRVRASPSPRPSPVEGEGDTSPLAPCGRGVGGEGWDSPESTLASPSPRPSPVEGEGDVAPLAPCGRGVGGEGGGH